MKTKSTVFSIVAVAILLVAAYSGIAQSGGNVAVVVNPANPIDNITAADLHKIYAGDKSSWGGGLIVAAFVRTAPSHERDVLLKAIMKMTDSQYQEAWVKKVYSGAAAHEPLALPSNSMQLEAVRSQKGGIAFIAASEVKDGVKVIKVDGVAPGGAGYSLK